MLNKLILLIVKIFNSKFPSKFKDEQIKLINLLIIKNHSLT